MQTEPIDLYECFRAFTKEEELGEDELWYGFNSFVNFFSLSVRPKWWRACTIFLVHPFFSAALFFLRTWGGVKRDGQTHHLHANLSRSSPSQLK